MSSLSVPVRISRRRALLLSALTAAAVAGACDVRNTQHDEQTRGPAISVISTNVDGPDAVIPSNGAIQIAFDRYLLPSTITRQSYRILDGNRQDLVDAFRTIYDPIARTVTILGPSEDDSEPRAAWLTEGQIYRLVLPVAPDDDDIGGFRAIDRATLAEPREYVFRAGPPATSTRLDPPVDFCADVMPLFRAKCSDPACHGATTRPASGLILQTVEGVRAAIGRVAVGANTTARAGTPEPPGKVFGSNMALIEPRNPGASWLIYKIELAPHTVVDAGTPPDIVCTPPPGEPPVPPRSTARYTPLVPFFRPAADDMERSILNDYVLGREMPYPYRPALYAGEDAYYFTPLTFEERERIRIWIASGASTRNCGGCDVVRPVADAGVGDAAP